jgi:UV DNA damage endonuclease
MTRPAYLGFAAQVLGRDGLRSHDARRWQSGPRLRVSLGCLRELFAYLDEVDIRLYRIGSGLAPYATHPDHPQFHDQVDACAAELAELGAEACRLGLRHSFHPSQFIVRNAPDLPPDVTLEAKAKDVAVSQLRHDLVRYAPDLAAVFGMEMTK